MLKIKNTKHLDTAEEIFTEFLDKFQKYAAEAEEISKGKDNLSPADKLKALECLETRYAALSNFFTGELGYEVRLEDGFLFTQYYFNRIFYFRQMASIEASRASRTAEAAERTFSRKSRRARRRWQASSGQSRRLKRRGTMLFTGSIAPRARRRIATTAAARNGIARYGGSASRRRR